MLTLILDISFRDWFIEVYLDELSNLLLDTLQTLTTDKDGNSIEDSIKELEDFDLVKRNIAQGSKEYSGLREDINNKVKSLRKTLDDKKKVIDNGKQSNKETRDVDVTIKQGIANLEDLLKSITANDFISKQNSMERNFHQ